ncbi:MAG: HAMP domain-containing sensor histidine kinase [Peptococcaceae bacterium]|nr:HAMP domain-containing sensor histidine kinase [Peptococcaceae bacterium]
MKWRSLEGGMRRTLMAILAATVAATLVTYVAAGVVFVVLQDRYIQPANYSEQQVENVETLVDTAGAALLQADAAALLDEAVGDSALTYQVVDADGNTLYGTYQSDRALDRQTLLKEINTAKGEAEGYVHTIPIFDAQGTFLGAVRCEYDFQLRFNRTEALSRLVAVFFVLALVSPLLYLFLFSWLFSRRFAASIRTPLEMLRSAVEKIQARELDFHIDYAADNELGALCQAFDDMKESLSQSLEREWQRDQQWREMVASLAHDLKTPLSVIKAYSESLADDTPVNEEQRGYLAVIANNVDRSTALIQRIQDVSLLEQAQGTEKTVSLDLCRFLTLQVEAYRLRGKQQGVQVMLELAANLSAAYAIDVERLTRILDNLVANSLAVMPSGGRIVLAVRQLGAHLEYEVRDTGPGFSARDLKHGTEQFYRGDDARSGNDGHAGLGLFIVQTLAVQLGGGMTLSNHPDGGACVRVWHPALPV